MGLPSEMSEAWASKRPSFTGGRLLPTSPVFSTPRPPLPKLVGCRVIPWAKANLNYTAQALIISAAAISGFFITADKTILNNARGNAIGKYDLHG
ncbi:hypothetical protein HPP92_008490 [Vanilla planifolia]|uniref:Uncharacterized protein n=1 Tax=Vanilla planifolia TaxID=51239 RepID=A0A835R6F2_VANPL|nr:hypothetical protein HPP92_008490 [Vanilla planifolia]